MNIIEKTVRQFHGSWDLCDPDRGAAIIAPNCRFEDVARGEAQIGPNGYRMDSQRWRAAFPDGEVKVVNVTSGGDGPDGWAVAEFLNRGSQIGNLHSSLGNFPPSGHRLKMRYCSVMRVQDGKVVEGRDYYDSASIARQLGEPSSAPVKTTQIRIALGALSSVARSRSSRRMPASEIGGCPC